MEKSSADGFELLPMAQGTDEAVDGQARLAIALLRSLAEGDPLDVSVPTRLAAELGTDEQSAEALISRNAEFDEQGKIIGFAGLSLRADHPHRFVVDGRGFTTWCAWDTLFLPALLQSSAAVESPDPETGQIIHLQVSPERITSALPEGAVVSFVDGVSGECVDVATTQAAFCQLVHFFADGLSAERFLAGRRAKGRVLSLEEGFALGQQLQKRMIAAARAMP